MITISIILGFIPILSFLAQYYFSKIEGNLESFKNNKQVYLCDWFFVPFNIFYLYSIDISFLILFLSFLLSFIGNIYIHFFYWLDVHLMEKTNSHIYNFNNNKLSFAGWSHFVFSVFQATIIFSFFLSGIKLPISYFSLSFLSFFFISFFYTSKKFHGKLILSDLIIGLLGILLIFFKILLNILD